MPRSSDDVLILNQKQRMKARTELVAAGECYVNICG